uniref:Uncharacterized protein n=1 Tax=Mycena chlorophos TaxID=658473 RepID=A0ABQ0KY32_MYCCL|nr:predicted protein [Mycena chlorophos]
MPVLTSPTSPFPLRPNPTADRIAAKHTLTAGQAPKQTHTWLPASFAPRARRQPRVGSAPKLQRQRKRVPAEQRLCEGRCLRGARRIGVRDEERDNVHVELGLDSPGLTLSQQERVGGLHNETSRVSRGVKTGSAPSLGKNPSQTRAVGPNAKVQARISRGPGDLRLGIAERANSPRNGEFAIWVVSSAEDGDSKPGRCRRGWRGFDEGGWIRGWEALNE